MNRKIDRGNLGCAIGVLYVCLWALVIWLVR